LLSSEALNASGEQRDDLVLRDADIDHNGAAVLERSLERRA
jgi:hypothetical protein